MSKEDLTFETKFKLTVVSMNINGTHPTIVRNKIWFLKFLSLFSMNALGTYLLAYSTLVHDIKNNNFTEACKNTSIIIICMNTSIKYIVLLYHRKSILNLIGVLNRDYELSKQFSPEDQSVVQGYARKGQMVCQFWLVCASCASTIFPVKAFFATCYSFWIGENQLIQMFYVSLPATMDPYKDSLYLYLGVSAFCIIFAFFASLMYIGFDPLIPIFTLHTCGQLDLLGRRISTAVSHGLTIQEKEKRLKYVIMRLQELYRFIDTVQSNFQVLNEFNMKTTTILLPVIGFNIVDDIRINKFNFEFLILLGGAVLHFLMPCYFSDMLIEKSEAFRQNVYSCGWEKYPDKSIRQTVLFMLTRATVPLGINTIFYILSLDTFSSMLRQAYSLFNLMNAAWGH